MHLVRRVLLALACATVALPASAAPVLIDFESLADGEIIAAQFSGDGATFSGGPMTLVAGLSLNEIDFPPRSGSNVASDAGGPITITFAHAVGLVSGYFTYNHALTLQAYRGVTSLGSVVSTLNDNTATLGGPVNEQLSFASPGGITSVVITGNAQGSSFALDDLEFEELQRVPEPSSMALLLIGLGLAGRRVTRRH